MHFSDSARFVFFLILVGIGFFFLNIKKMLTAYMATTARGAMRLIGLSRRKAFQHKKFAPELLYCPYAFMNVHIKGQAFGEGIPPRDPAFYYYWNIYSFNFVNHIYSIIKKLKR